MNAALVVGAGPAGLIAAETLARSGARVVVFDGAPSPARKFLFAGRGGLNLTHSEPLETLLARYGASAGRLRPAIEAFAPAALREWAAGLGEPTFVGSSGRVFPKSFKATPLLRAWLRRLGDLGVELQPRRRFVGFADGGGLRFVSPQGEERVAPDVCVMALGGASWPRLGSDGGWVEPFRVIGVAVAPLAPANCGFRVAWSAPMRERFAGAPLKAIALTHDGARVRGEATITAEGIEGGAVYALSAVLRETIARDGAATLSVDLKPDVEEAALAQRLVGKPRQSLATRLRKGAGLAPAAAMLLRVAGDPPREALALAARIKRCPLRLVATTGIARAISSAGGVAWSELDDGFMLIRRPGLFLAGEMLDWEAPTGGYLLQACFSTGVAAGRGAAAWLARPR